MCIFPYHLAYPLPDESVREYFLAPESRSNLGYKKRCFCFFANLAEQVTYCLATEDALRVAAQYGHVSLAKAWRNYLQIHRTSLYQNVVKSSDTNVR